MVNIFVKNKQYLKIKITGDDITFIADVIKEMPVRGYDGFNKYWYVPIKDYKQLIKKLIKNDIIHSINNIDLINKRISLFSKWSNKQLLLKNKPNKHSKFSKMDILKLSMHPFQTIGAYFLYHGKNAYIGDPVGLGKTNQSLSANERNLNEGKINFVIIICPSTLKPNWKDEIEKFTDRTYVIVGGSKYKRKSIYKKSYRYDYMILNYDLLKWDIDLIEEYILMNDNIQFCLVIDEAQYINNRNAIRSKMVRRIATYAKFRYGLSATLLEKNIIDLFNNFMAIDTTVFGNNENYYSFLKKYVELDFFGNYKSMKNKKMLKQRMAPYFIRRFKEDVLDQLPKRIENNYWIELDTKHKRIYNDVEKKVVTELKNLEKAAKIKVATILPMIIYLKQCAIGTALIDHKENLSTKASFLLNLIQNDIDAQSRLLIFCHYPKMIEILYKFLTKNHISCMAMHGKTKYDHGCKINDRVDMIAHWQRSNNKVLLTSDILSVGVNITKANYQINFDLLLNPFRMEQRAGRIDRIGNVHKTVNIINLITLGTVEERIYEIIYNKLQLHKTIIDDDKTEKRLSIVHLKNLINK